MNLFILDICIPDKGWQTPRVFGEDIPSEMAELESAEKEAREKNYTVTTKRIHGMAVEPLRQYLLAH